MCLGVPAKILETGDSTAVVGRLLRSVHTNPSVMSPGTTIAPLATSPWRRSAIPYPSSSSGL